MSIVCWVYRACPDEVAALEGEGSVSTVEVTEQKILDDMRRDERQRVEFKESFIKTGDLAECIMAFANAEGGTIYSRFAYFSGSFRDSSPKPGGSVLWMLILV